MQRRAAPTQRQARKPRTQPADEQGKYVYAIIESQDARSFGNIGIVGRGDLVHTVHHDGLAAVVSNTPVVIYDPTRDNALAHETVNETVMKEFTVTPMSFGTVFRTEDDMTEFLKHTSDALRDVLAKMKSRIEFGMKINWEVEAVLQEVEKDLEDIRLLKGEISAKRNNSTYFARMQLGRLVEQALDERSTLYVSEVLGSLRDYAVASRQNKPIGDMPLKPAL